MKMYKMLGLAGVLASGRAIAASEVTHALHVSVPFAFVVAGEQFAPGDYEVRETQTGVITVQGEGKATAVISTPLAISKPGKSSALRFDGSPRRDLLSVAVEGDVTRGVPVHPPQERKVSLASR